MIFKVKEPIVVTIYESEEESVDETLGPNEEIEVDLLSNDNGILNIQFGDGSITWINNQDITIINE